MDAVASLQAPPASGSAVAEIHVIPNLSRRRENLGDAAWRSANAMANMVNSWKSNGRFASLPDVPPACVLRNKQSRLPWDVISFIGSGVRQTLGSRASHNRRTSFGTVASQMLCSPFVGSATL
jgi:hypothetical protein